MGGAEERRRAVFQDDGENVGEQRWLSGGTTSRVGVGRRLANH
jgi:hypothetical protein